MNTKTAWFWTVILEKEVLPAVLFLWPSFFYINHAVRFISLIYCDNQYINVNGSGFGVSDLRGSDFLKQ